MINKIKLKIEKYKGKKLNFKFNGSRNQIEEFTGIIDKTYNYIFTIKLINDGNIIKCFSYSDVLTESLEIFVN